MGKNNRHIVYALFLTGILCACGSASSPSGQDVFIPTATAEATLDFLPPPASTPMPSDQTSLESVPSPTLDISAPPTTDAVPSDTSASGPVPQESAALSPTAFLTPDPSRPTSKYGLLCDDSLFVEDVTIPDGTPMKPGEGFKKTWRFKNTGVCTWTTAYAIGYAYGEKMHGSETKLTKSIAPGGTVDVSINFTAPLMKNCWYGSWWRLKNASGVYFGDFVYVSILISDGIDTTTVCPTQTPGI
jgi:hypothetical protein